MIVHIAEAEAWRKAQKLGEYRPASLGAQGFIHCSDPDQVAGVATYVYRGRADLVLLWIDPSRLAHEVRYEDGGDGELYPHLYGPLIVDAVVAVRPFTPRADGTFDRPAEPAQGGFQVYPGAPPPRGPFSPVKPGRVVGLGAICDLGPERPDQPRSRSYSVSEFVALEDGRRVILHEDRGFTIGWGPSDDGQETLESLTRDVLTTVLPDDAEQTGEDHPWKWLAELARARGLHVTADDLRSLPYEVIFTDRVQRIAFA